MDNLNRICDCFWVLVIEMNLSGWIVLHGVAYDPICIYLFFIRLLAMGLRELI